MDREQPVELLQVRLDRRLHVGILQLDGEPLSTGRLLTLDWLDGAKLLTHKGADLETRNRIGQAMFTAWWLPFCRFGVIHGDPHLGNYSVFTEKGKPSGINLLDYGCIRIFPPKFVGGVVDLYNGLRTDNQIGRAHV